MEKEHTRLSPLAPLVLAVATAASLASPTAHGKQLAQLGEQPTPDAVQAQTASDAYFACFKRLDTQVNFCDIRAPQGRDYCLTSASANFVRCLGGVEGPLRASSADPDAAIDDCIDRARPLENICSSLPGEDDAARFIRELCGSEARALAMECIDPPRKLTPEPRHDRLPLRMIRQGRARASNEGSPAAFFY
ncbi:hypothetical protein CO046_04005 [Candidatus Peregrinibacteria bacterium CG_4_9_14_0_2_um_filter_53_11]|nr:MAG: hypothetical protein CO046_04005 [Candidatus Peregrinibacteria bacterium CG_4_9_14_0_2_um_filter_53_11]